MISEEISFTQKSNCFSSDSLSFFMLTAVFCFEEDRNVRNLFLQQN